MAVFIFVLVEMADLAYRVSTGERRQRCCSPWNDRGEHLILGVVLGPGLS